MGRIGDVPGPQTFPRNSPRPHSCGVHCPNLLCESRTAGTHLIPSEESACGSRVRSDKATPRPARAVPNPLHHNRHQQKPSASTPETPRVENSSFRGETVPDSLSATPKSPPTRRGPWRGTPRVPAPLPLSPFSPPDRDRRGDSPAQAPRRAVCGTRGSLRTQRHPGKFPKVPGRRRARRVRACAPLN